jgi:predicted ATPase/transcriptional regulator with XRE-family HTH domain
MAQDRPPFGSLLRRYRRLAHLTQEGLAERAGYSPDYVGMLERGVRRASPPTIDLLADVLALDAANRSALQWAADELRVDGRHAYGLLPEDATPFIGRAVDVACIQDLLRRGDVRLVTLMGTGGVGKTRLAIQAGRAMLDRFPDGVIFVPLVSVLAPRDVPHAVASALGPGPAVQDSAIDVIRHQLRQKRVLLILDNYEHLLPASDVIGDLLDISSDVSVLVTSRERLHVSREVVYDISPLSTPPETGSSPADLGRFDAIRLFVERARAVQRVFDPTDDDLVTIAAICRRLEGLPLAVELAAARVRYLPLPALLERLSHRVRFLTGGPRDVSLRHQTVRNTIAWSDALLSPDERLLFARLAVFRGGWTLESAQAVCDPGGRLDVDRGIESLLDKSLIQPAEMSDRLPRYSMLEVVAEYAAEQLDAAGESESLRLQHGRYFAGLMEDLGDATVARDRAKALRAIELEVPNADAALRWAAEVGEVELALQLLNSTFKPSHRARIRDYEPWYVLLLTRAESVSPPVRAQALANSILMGLDRTHSGILPPDKERGWVLDECVRVIESEAPKWRQSSFLSFVALECGLQGDYVRCERYAQSSLRTARQLEAPLAIAGGLRALAEAEMGLGRLDVSIAYYEEALAIDRSVGNRAGVAYSLHGLAYRRLLRRESRWAMALAHEAISLYHEFGELFGWAQVELILACAALKEGEPDVAGDAVRAVLTETRLAGTAPLRSQIIAVLAASLAAQGHVLEAARGFAAVDPQNPDQLTRLFIKPILSEARATADPAAWDAAWREGSMLSPDEAAELLLASAGAESLTK